MPAVAQTIRGKRDTHGGGRIVTFKVKTASLRVTNEIQTEMRSSLKWSERIAAKMRRLLGIPIPVLLLIFPNAALHIPIETNQPTINLCCGPYLEFFSFCGFWV